MKHTCRRILIGLSSLLVAGATTLPGAAKQPVLFVPIVRFSDHFNFQLTLNRLNAALALAESSADVSPVLLFSGTVAEILGDQNPHTHTVDRIRELVERKRLDIGYDGSQEPTPLTRPRPNFRLAATPEDFWKARLEAYEWFLTEHKDHFRGDPDPSRAGGLKRFVETFGPPSYITGLKTELEGDSELVYLLRKRNLNAVLDGLSDAETTPGRNVHGFRTEALTFSRILSPSEQFAPELHWQDGYLRLSSAEGGVTRAIRGFEGKASAEKLLTALDRMKTQIVLLNLFEERHYIHPTFYTTPDLTPALFGYLNPRSPLLLDTVLQPEAAVAKSLGDEQTMLAFLRTEFIPRNAGSRFVTTRELLRVTEPGRRPSMDPVALAGAAMDLLNRWKATGYQPPSFAQSAERYYSLAELFELLALALAERNLQSEYSGTLYGPSLMGEEPSGGAAQLSVEAVKSKCKEIVARWSQSQRPASIPVRIKLGSLDINAAQFLKVMAKTFVDGHRLREVSLDNAGMISGAGYATPMSVRPVERRASWTLKPAHLR